VRYVKGLNLTRNTQQRFEANIIDSITCGQWVTTNGSTLEITVQYCSDFHESFAEMLNILPHHCFIA
jgi:hypothetical protein